MVSRWKKVVTRGVVHGTVTTGSGPLAGAFVQL